MTVNNKEATSEVDDPPVVKRSRLSLKSSAANKKNIKPKKETTDTVKTEITEETAKKENEEEQPINGDCSEKFDACADAYQESEVDKPKLAAVASLVNMGNTCFLNSVIQILRYTPRFVRGIHYLSKELQFFNEARKQQGNDEKMSTEWKLVTGLGKLFSDMKSVEKSYQPGADLDSLAVRPYEVLDCIRLLNPMFEGNLQHDAQELLRCVLCYVEDSAKNLVAEKRQMPGLEDLQINQNIPVELHHAVVKQEDTSSPSRGASDVSPCKLSPTMQGRRLPTSPNKYSVQIDEKIEELGVKEEVKEDQEKKWSPKIESDSTPVIRVKDEAKKEENFDDMKEEDIEVDDDDDDDSLLSKKHAPNTRYFDQLQPATIKNDCYVSTDLKKPISIHATAPVDRVDGFDSEPMIPQAAEACEADRPMCRESPVRPVRPCSQTYSKRQSRRSTPEDDVWERIMSNRTEGCVSPRRSIHAYRPSKSSVSMTKNAGSDAETDDDGANTMKSLRPRRSVTPISAVYSDDELVKNSSKTRSAPSILIPVAKTLRRSSRGGGSTGAVSSRNPRKRSNDGSAELDDGRADKRRRRRRTVSSGDPAAAINTDDKIGNNSAKSKRKSSPETSSAQTQGIKSYFTAEATTPCKRLGVRGARVTKPSTVDHSADKSIKVRGGNKECIGLMNNCGGATASDTNALESTVETTNKRLTASASKTIRKTPLRQAKLNHSFTKPNSSARKILFNDSEQRRGVVTVDDVNHSESTAERLKHDAMNGARTPVVCLRKLEDSDVARKYPEISATLHKQTTLQSEYDEKRVHVVEEIFQGEMTLKTKCLECESCTSRNENFQDIGIPVRIRNDGDEDDKENEEDDSEFDIDTDKKPTSWMLNAMSEVERLRDDNRYYCDTCQHLCEAERSLHYMTMPDVLTFHLKRFKATSGLFGGLSKINDQVIIPFDFSCFSAKCVQPCNQHWYELYGMIMHCGVTLSAGHYTAYVKMPADRTAFDNPPAEHGQGDGNDVATEQLMTDHNGETKLMLMNSSLVDKWLECDDTMVHAYTQQQFKELLSSASNCTPYVLFYRRC
ncbi:uncharacterized protein LOC141907542 [Tubulanus polymorphus]|uniref:uncharacterized protein LOC141907542 n=1 Tax=Tubulanus polymorphus TaxID=672921 RepID=UPI003DA3B829